MKLDVDWILQYSVFGIDSHVSWQAPQTRLLGFCHTAPVASQARGPPASDETAAGRESSLLIVAAPGVAIVCVESGVQVEALEAQFPLSRILPRLRNNRWYLWQSLQLPA